MTKNQMILASLLVAVPALGLIGGLAIAVGGVAQGAMMWGLFGATLLLSIAAFASPVVVWLLIPATGAAAALLPDASPPAQPGPGKSSDTDSDGEELEDGEEPAAEDDNTVEADVTESLDLDDFDEEDNFESLDNDEEFDDFDDDEDFV